MINAITQTITEAKYLSEINPLLVTHPQKLTYTDLALMHSLLIAERDCPENIKTLPTLCALRDRVKDTDGVKQYLASRPQLPF